MIKLGVCTAVENAGTLAALGYDYIELGLSATAALSGQEFRALKAQLGGLPCEAMNGMMPSSLPVTGPHVDREAVLGYLGPALDRARELGVQVIVFGSGGSRMVPEGFPRAEAIRQLRDFLNLAGDEAAKRGEKIAIEPLRREECNIINYVAEAQILAALTDHPAVGILGDTYHMDAVSEPLTALENAGGQLLHIHTARPGSRSYPREGDGALEHYRELFDILNRSGYRGRVSVEGGTQEFQGDAQASFRLISGLK